ncbi:MAG: 4a-hydroxytetrahydrobiopterin dehydratase [Actinomycetota bacterium]|nr:4a-hydroxytetrahydrobiopterin dehydratase [Actinomycetota bacterium]
MTESAGVAPASPSPTPSRERLEPDGVTAGLARLPAWEGDRSAIVRTVQMPDFPAVIDLVTAVARVAEAMDHHPDIDIRWRTVRFSLSTHSSGGVTETDLVAAETIEALIAGSSSSV